MEKHEASQHIIHIQLMATLGKHSPPEGTLVICLGDTVQNVIQRLGINPEMVHMAFVDGQFISFEKPLDKAKRLLLLPAIGGG